LVAAVDGFVRHFGSPRVSAVGFLPLHHVSGLMAWLRCGLTGGTYVPAAWADVEDGRFPELPPGEVFVSVVPTQLQRLLGRPAAVAWLRRFRAVFVGGGPVWPDLLERAAEARLPLAPSYGMTETAAMVAALTPEQFAAGRRTCGRALPHARIATGADGRIEVCGPSVHRGYFPKFDDDDVLQTSDTGMIGTDGHLSEIARADDVIISGGEKVDPAAVEAVLRDTGAFSDVAVVGAPHAEWGTEVVALYPGPAIAVDWARVQEAVRRQLAPARRPKRYVLVTDWPRNAQGKLNRALLRGRARGE
jgi:o-succinylbenzoate---CoA ligase